MNAASYLPGISPGGIASIFGPNLSVVTDIQYSTTFDPLSTVIADVSVAVNGVFAPLFAVAYTGGQDQINIQVPYETPTGLGAAVVDVYSGNTLVAHEVVDSYTEDPGIFIDGNYNAIAVHVDDFSLITADNPAVPNEYIVLYTTGLGPLDVPLLDGYGAPSTEPLARTLDQTFQAQINGENCGLLFSGLGPGFVGLYQLNLQLPSDLPPGRLPLQINTIYADSGVAYLSVN